MNLPNSITLARVILVPFVCWLVLSGRFDLAAGAFIAAGLSDAVDGYLAKRWNQRTQLGAYLDPLADKLLLVTVYVTLGIKGELPSWLVVAVVSRDVLILLAVGLAIVLDHSIAIRPLVVSKANTAAQIVLAAVVLVDAGFGLGLTRLRTLMIWVTLGFTVVSLVAYLRIWIGVMGEANGASRGTDRS